MYVFLYVTARVLSGYRDLVAVVGGGGRWTVDDRRQWRHKLEKVCGVSDESSRAVLCMYVICR